MALKSVLNDPDAWEDKELVDSWNAAYDEYKKFHSIHASGKSLVEALTKEEIEDLQSRGLGLGKKRPREGDEDEQEADEDGCVDESYEEEIVEQIREIPIATNGYSDTVAGMEDVAPTSSTMEPSKPDIPEVLMSSVQDESLKNLMMAWYWAGYYTGLQQGQNAGQLRKG